MKFTFCLRDITQFKMLSWQHWFHSNTTHHAHLLRTSASSVFFFCVRALRRGMYHTPMHTTMLEHDDNILNSLNGDRWRCDWYFYQSFVCLLYMLSIELFCIAIIAFPKNMASSWRFKLKRTHKNTQPISTILFIWVLRLATHTHTQTHIYPRIQPRSSFAVCMGECVRVLFRIIHLAQSHYWELYSCATHTLKPRRNHDIYLPHKIIPDTSTCAEQIAPNHGEATHLRLKRGWH